MRTLILLTLLVGLSAYAQPSQGPYPSGGGTNGGGPPTGAAGGALSGTYPNPTLAQPITGNGSGLTSLAYTNLVNRLLFANLRDFGAVGNGSTDDSTAIQNWLTYCYTNSMNGYAPAGHYYTTKSNIFTVPAGYPNLFGSWKLIGDGPSQTVFIEGTTNADLFVNVSGIQGTFIEGIGFVGPGDGIHAVGTRLLVFGTNGAANANLIQNCGFYNSWIGCYAWAENTKFDTCTFQDNITGLIWPNNVVGNNNDVVANCQFTEGILAGKLATNATSCTNLVFYAGGGHAVFGSTFTGLKSSDIGIAIPQSGVGINLTADYVEMNGCGEFVKAVPANGIGHINMYSCTGITGGADGNTNHYPVEIGGGMSLTVDYGDSFGFWSSKSLYKQNNFANTFIDFSGYNSAITVDEYSSGSYLYTLLITPSVLYVASSTSTNAIGANGQTMTVNGVNVFGIDSFGNVTGNSFVPTSTSTGPSYGYYSGGSALQISSGANGGYINGQSSGNFLHWDGSGNFTITNGLTVGQTLTVSGTGTSSVAGALTVTGLLNASTAVNTPYGYVSGNAYQTVFTNISGVARLVFRTGADNSAGTITVNGTTAVAISNTDVTANSVIFYTIVPGTTPSATVGQIYTFSLTANSGFSVKSTSSTDTTTQYRFVIVEIY